MKMHTGKQLYTALHQIIKHYIWHKKYSVWEDKIKTSLLCDWHRGNAHDIVSTYVLKNGGRGLNDGKLKAK